MKVRKNPKCPICGPNPTITALIDYQEFCGVRGVRAGDRNAGRRRRRDHGARTQGPDRPRRAAVHPRRAEPRGDRHLPDRGVDRHPLARTAGRARRTRPRRADGRPLQERQAKREGDRGAPRGTGSPGSRTSTGASSPGSRTSTRACPAIDAAQNRARSSFVGHGRLKDVRIAPGSQVRVRPFFLRRRPVAPTASAKGRGVVNHLSGLGDRRCSGSGGHDRRGPGPPRAARRADGQQPAPQATGSAPATTTRSSKATGSAPATTTRSSKGNGFGTGL